MAGLGGPLGTGDMRSANIVDYNISTDIMRLVKDKTPAMNYVLGKATRKESVDTPEWFWFEDDNYTWHWQLSLSTYGSADVTLTIADNTYLKVGDLLKNPSTGEVIRITAKDAGGYTITVVRAATFSATYGGSGPSSILTTDYLVMIGNVNQEGGALPSAIQTVESRKYGGVQEIRDPFKLTWVLEATKLYTGDPNKQEPIKMAIQHALKMERLALFGEYRLDLSVAGSARFPARYSHGLLANCGGTTNVAGPLTEDAWEFFLEDAFRWCANKKQKLFLCSRRIATYLNSFAREKIQVVQDKSTYGVRIQRMESAHGTVDIAVHDMLEQGYSGYGIMVDVPLCKWRPQEGNGKNLDTQLIDHGSISGESANTYEYYTVAGLEVRGGSSSYPHHYKMYGVT